METEKIMDEVVEVIEMPIEVEAMPKNKGGLAIVAVAGAVVIGGALAYKYIVKPVKAKIKAKKEKGEAVEVEACEICENDIM